MKNLKIIDVVGVAYFTALTVALVWVGTGWHPENMAICSHVAGTILLVLFTGQIIKEKVGGFVLVPVAIWVLTLIWVIGALIC